MHCHRCELLVPRSYLLGRNFDSAMKDAHMQFNVPQASLRGIHLAPAQVENLMPVASLCLFLIFVNSSQLGGASIQVSTKKCAS